MGLIGNIESPLAGGFFTGNFSIGNDVSGTRFAEDNSGSGIFKKMYDKQVMNLAIKDLHTFLRQRDISLAEASLRWLYHHSAVETEDGLILGATKVAQLEKNVADIEKGPSPE